jgi:LuxR family maltose regulon positive regulatory protein
MGHVAKTSEPGRFSRVVVARERLLGFLDEIDRSRITTICAPAGYGKTAAMTQWAQALAARGRKIIWVAPRFGISTVETFISALTEGFVKSDFEWPNLPADRSPASYIAELMVAQPARPVLVIDDAQILSTSVLHLVSDIIMTARDSMTTLIACRGAPMIPVARLHSLGLRFEVTAADLRFSYEDAVELVSRNARGAIDEADLRALVEETHGWAAGIAMACARSRFRASPNGGISAKAGALSLDIEQYFAEEVMLPQSQEVRDFIVSTAVLDELSPNACVAVTALENSRRMLEFVERAGLFLDLVDVERSVYVYQPLFRAMVLRRLKNYDPERASELHRRASRYFATAGDVARAMEHAAASLDQVFLADQLDALSEPLIYAGYLFRIEELSETLPWSLTVSRPMLMLALAWRNIRRLNFRQAETLISTVADQVAKLHDDGAIEACQHVYLQRLIAHRRVMLDAALDDMPKVEQAAEKLLAEFGDDHAYLSCTLLAQLMAARRELYHFQDMPKLEAETRRALNRPGADFASIAMKASIAPTLVVQGKTESARRLLREALTLACTLQGEGSGLAALPALPLAELLYDCNELDEAKALVDAHIPVARLWGFVDQLASAHLVRARLLVAAGQVEAALSGLQEASLIALECGLDRLRVLVVAEQVRILVRNGQPAQAQAIFDNSGFAPAGEPLPTMSPVRRSETIAIAWLRLEIQNHRLVRARKIANRWCELGRRTGVLRSVVTFELLLAEIAVLAGNRSEARRAVREAVSIAAQAGWIRIFLDEGEAIGALIIEAYGQGPVLDTPPDRLAAKLVVAFKGRLVPEQDEECGLGSKLANREMDILGMVAGGLRNREIGNRLGLTEGTVKWYMQQIYDKLGVRRRPQAVMRARQLGLMA